MTATTKTYLQRLPVAFGVLVITCIIRYAIVHGGQTDSNAVTNWPKLLSFFSTSVGILAAFAILTQTLNQLIIPLSLQAAVTAFHFLITRTIDNDFVPDVLKAGLSVYSYIELLPWLFYVSRQTPFWKKHRLPIIGAVFIVYKILIARISGFPLGENESVLDDDSSVLYETVSLMAFQVASWCGFIIILAELTGYSQRNERPAINTIVIDETRDNRGSTLAFFTFKCLLLLLPLMMPVIAVKGGYQSLADPHGNDDLVNYYFKFDWCLTIAGGLMLTAATAIYLRALILSFLIRHQITIRFAFLLLVVPLIGLITWLLIGAFRKPTIRKEQLVLNYQRFCNDKTIVAIGAVLVFYTIGGWWLSSMSARPENVYYFGGTFLFFLVYAIWQKGYLIQSALQVLLLLYVVVLNLLHGAPTTGYYTPSSPGLEDDFYFRFYFFSQLVFVGFGWSMTLLPAFHPGYFKTNLYHHTVIEEGHLFAEHELQQ